MSSQTILYSILCISTTSASARRLDLIFSGCSHTVNDVVKASPWKTTPIADKCVCLSAATTCLSSRTCPHVLYLWLCDWFMRLCVIMLHNIIFLSPYQHECPPLSCILSLCVACFKYYLSLYDEHAVFLFINFYLFCTIINVNNHLLLHSVCIVTL